MIIILSSPSGAGKSTIVRYILNCITQIKLSVSCTTRKPRNDERDSIDYYFIDDECYERMKSRGELLEHARVFNYHYGTPKAPVIKALKEGYDILFDIDWQGARQIRNIMNNDVISLFILPPSIKELERRLYVRATDSEEDVCYRMNHASQEISHYQEYDWVLINDDLSTTCANVETIIKSERQRFMRQSTNFFAKQLLSKIDS